MYWDCAVRCGIAKSYFRLTLDEKLSISKLNERWVMIEGEEEFQSKHKQAKKQADKT